MRRILLSFLLVSIALVSTKKISGTCIYTEPSKCTSGTTDGTTKGINGITLSVGELTGTFRANVPGSKSGQINGVTPLISSFVPTVNAFQPYGSGAGLNCEHIINAYNDTRNSFGCRIGTMTITQLDNTTVQLVEPDTPYHVGVTLTYHMVAPHMIDLDARFLVNDASQFGDLGYMVVMFADYMSAVQSVNLNFLGQPAQDQPQQWISADAPFNPYTQAGGTYRNINAEALDISHAGADSNLNIFSYDWPRFTQPFYCGLSRNNMTYELMFDKSFTSEDEIRLTLFKFLVKSDPNNPQPAWDWQYVVHQVVSGTIYGFKARVIWEPYQGLDHCWANYQNWIP